MTHKLVALVDYDNLARVAKNWPLPALVEFLSEKVLANDWAEVDSFTVRLYGGWHSVSTITRAAQLLTGQIQAAFPRVVTRRSGGVYSRPITATVELAYSGLFAPNASLKETLARNRPARNLYLRNRPWPGCANSGVCGLNVVDTSISSDLCPTTGCAIAPSAVLLRDEQKQVDTLLVADLAYLTLVEHSPLVLIVSSDADMWPGILLGVNSGTRILQIHTTFGGSTPPHLMQSLRAANQHYAQTAF